MKKLLFIAGEPGAGKTTQIADPLRENGHGLVINTDQISGRAAQHYQGSLGRRWQLWKLEFDNNLKLDQLEKAYLQEMREREGEPVDQAAAVIVEGVLSGHPAFRSAMREVIASLGFTADEVLTVAICPPWDQLQQNVAKRGRPEDHSIRFVKDRRDDYHRRLSSQEDVHRYQTTNECYQAAVKSLTS